MLSIKTTSVKIKINYGSIYFNEKTRFSIHKIFINSKNCSKRNIYSLYMGNKFENKIKI